MPNDSATANNAQTLDALLQHPALWRASRTSSIHHDAAANSTGSDTGSDVVSTGFRQLDTLLHAGGWPLGKLLECLSPRLPSPQQLNSQSQGIGQGPLQLFLPALRHCAASSKPVLLVAPPHMPYLPGWQLPANGNTAGPGLWVVTPADTAGMLWAAEQILQSNSSSAVFIWLAQTDQRPSHLHSTALRKLQLAARCSNGLVVVFREADALQQPSPAALRLLVKPVAINQSTQLGVHIAKQPGGWGGQQTRINWHSRLQRPVMPATRWPVYQPDDCATHNNRPGNALPLLGTRAAKWS